jgi:AcrR family transcriptional regulator
MFDSAPGTGSIASFLHRSRILEAAARVFARHGVRQVSVEDLLEAASVSRRTFYRYFRSKEDVLRVLHAVSVQYLLDRVRQAMDTTPDPAKKLERFVDTYLSFNRTDAELFRVLEIEALRPDTPLARTRAQVVEALAALLADELQGVFGQRPDPWLLMGLLAGLTGVSVQLHALGAVTPAHLERARRVMLRMLLAGLAPKGAPVPPLPLAPVPPRATRAGRPPPKARSGGRAQRRKK